MLPILLLLIGFTSDQLRPEPVNVILANGVACLLHEGMSEAEVTAILGNTIYSLRASSLGGSSVYPGYRLRLDFSYTGEGLLSARYVRLVKDAKGITQFQSLQIIELGSNSPIMRFFTRLLASYR